MIACGGWDAAGYALAALLIVITIGIVVAAAWLVHGERGS